jgi:hypothetical protein
MFVVGQSRRFSRASAISGLPRSAEIFRAARLKGAIKRHSVTCSITLPALATPTDGRPHLRTGQSLGEPRAAD